MKLLQLLVIPFLILSAQAELQPVNSDCEKSTTTSMIFHCTTWEKYDTKFSYSVNDGAQRTIQPNALFYGKPTTIQGCKITFFYTNKEGTKVQFGSMHTKWSNQLFLIKHDSVKETYQLHAFNDTPQKDWGSITYHNLTDLSIEGKIGDKDFYLKEDNSATIATGERTKEGLFLKMWHTSEGKEKILARNTIFPNPQKQLIVFLDQKKAANGRVTLINRAMSRFKTP